MKKNICYFFLFFGLSLLLVCTGLALKEIPETTESEESAAIQEGEAGTLPIIPSAGESNNVPLEVLGDENVNEPPASSDEKSGELSVISPGVEPSEIPVTPPEDESSQAPATEEGEGKKPDHIPENERDVTDYNPAVKESEPVDDELNEYPSILLKNMTDKDRFGTITVEKEEDGSWIIVKEEYYVSQKLRAGVNIGLGIAVFLIFLCGALLYGVLRRRLNEK